MTSVSPESHALKYMEELASWTPESQDPMLISQTPLRRRKRKNETSKVILCHDMCGGYCEDRFTQGCLIDGNQPYRFDFWQYYFSHYSITIPPATWITTAHRQGVQVMGTFITECIQGVIINLQLLYGPDYMIPNAEEIYKKGMPKPPGEEDNKTEISTNSKERSSFNPFFAEKLISMSKTFGLDGWFFNIESPLRDDYDVKIMTEFLAYMTQRMHEELPGSLVIWYDSLIDNGNILWKNKLCADNSTFFESTDGIFTNYTWRSTYPQESVGFLKEMQSGKRLNVKQDGDKTEKEIYTGIDCWGRNTYGGGGWNCHKALRVVKNAQTSIAIFAPAWTYENFQGKRFEEKELKFWCDSSLPLIVDNDWVIVCCEEDSDMVNLDSKVNVKKQSTDMDPRDLGCISDYVEERICSGGPDWFYSNFCQGSGNQYYIQGKMVSDRKWFYLSKQNILPSFRASKYIENIIMSLKDNDQKRKLVLCENEKDHSKNSLITENEILITQHAMELSSEHGAYQGGSGLLLTRETTLIDELKQNKSIFTATLFRVFKTEVIIHPYSCCQIQVKFVEGGDDGELYLGLYIVVERDGSRGQPSIQQKIIVGSSKDITGQINREEWISLPYAFEKLFSHEKNSQNTISSLKVCEIGFILSEVPFDSCSVTLDNFSDLCSCTSFEKDFIVVNQSKKRSNQTHYLKSKKKKTQILLGEVLLIGPSSLSSLNGGPNRIGGQTSIANAGSKPHDESTRVKTVSVLKDGNNFVDISWKPHPQAEYWELFYEKNQWIGTSYIPMYRISQISLGDIDRIKIIEYDLFCRQL